MVRETKYRIDKPVFFAYDKAGLIIVGTSLTDITWDTEVVKHPMFTHDDDSATITIGKRVYGYYKIYAEVSNYNSTDNSRSEASFWLYDVKEETGLEGSRFFNYNRAVDPVVGSTTASVNYVWFVNEEKDLKIQGKNTEGIRTLRTNPNGCRIYIEYLG